MAEMLITGATGQLGRALLAQAGARAVGAGREQLDLSKDNISDVLSALHAEHGFSALINAAAFTRVDDAEDEEAEAERVNARAVGEMARWCAARGVMMVQISTDYVFGDDARTPRHEDEPPAPLNAYGRSKLAGERAVAAAGGAHLIIRTSWLYDGVGKNFFTTMRRLMQERDMVRVVDDQVGAPTYVPHFAAAILRALEAARRMEVFPSGVYHLTHGGQVSWYGFAQAILEQTQGARCTRIEPISSAEYGAKAARPKNSRLDSSKILRVLDVWLPHWEVGLLECAA